MAHHTRRLGGANHAGNSHLVRQWQPYHMPNGPEEDLAAEQSAVPSQFMRQTVAPYNNRYQPDQAVHYFQRLREAGNVTNVFVPEIIENAPPKVHMAEYFAKIAKANTPQLFIPGNSSRQYFTVVNNTGATIFLQFGRSQGNGIPVLNNSMFQQQGGTVTIDDIWVRGTVQNAVITGYQGILSAGMDRNARRTVKHRSKTP